MMLDYWIMSLFLFVLGAVAGSFLNVCIYRIPQHPDLVSQLRSLVHPPSTCPRCRTRIGWRDNIPIVSWCLLRGRCRHCRMWISLRYPLVELLNGMLFVVLYLAEIPTTWPFTVTGSCLFTEDLGPQVVPGLGALSPAAFLYLRYFYHLVLIEALMVASFIDLDRREIPDASTLPAMAVGLLGGLLSGRVHILPAWYQNSALVRTFTHLISPDWNVGLWPNVPAWFTTWPHLHGLLVSVAGLVVGGGVTWLVRIIGFRVLKREAMGFGDVILMALIGSFLGWQVALITFFVAPLCALAVVLVQLLFKRERYIPYGPYLSLATLLVIVDWQRILPAANRFLTLGPLLPIVFLIMMLCFVVTLYLMRGAKRLLGFQPEAEEEWVAEWTPADQHHYLAGEQADRCRGRWPRHDWPGVPAGRGSLHGERWRCGGPNCPCPHPPPRHDWRGR